MLILQLCWWAAMFWYIFLNVVHNVFLPVSTGRDGVVLAVSYVMKFKPPVRICLSARCTRLCTFLLVQAYQKQVPSLVLLPAWYDARFQRLTRFCAPRPATDNSVILLFANSYFGSPFQKNPPKLFFVNSWFKSSEVLAKDAIGNSEYMGYHLRMFWIATLPACRFLSTTYKYKLCFFFQGKWTYQHMQILPHFTFKAINQQGTRQDIVHLFTHKAMV